MRMIFINAILCLFIVLIGIAFSSSSAIDTDDFAAANFDWNDFDSYPSHFLNARAAKSRFWKRRQPSRFWKRSLSESALNEMTDSANNQHEEKH